MRFEEDSSHVMAWGNMAVAHIDRRQFQDPLHCHRQALAVQPESDELRRAVHDFRCHRSIREHSQRQRRKQKRPSDLPITRSQHHAASHISLLVSERSAKCVEAMYTLGVDLIENGEKEKAIFIYDTAIRCNRRLQQASAGSPQQPRRHLQGRWTEIRRRFSASRMPFPCSLTSPWCLSSNEVSRTDEWLFPESEQSATALSMQTKKHLYLYSLRDIIGLDLWRYNGKPPFPAGSSSAVFFQCGHHRNVRELLHGRCLIDDGRKVPRAERRIEPDLCGGFR